MISNQNDSNKTILVAMNFTIPHNNQSLNQRQIEQNKKI